MMDSRKTGPRSLRILHPPIDYTSCIGGLSHLIVAETKFEARVKSACAPPMYKANNRMNIDSTQVPPQVSRALRHTQNYKGYLFIRQTPPEMLPLTTSGMRSPFAFHERKGLKTAEMHSSGDKSSGIPSENGEPLSSLSYESQTTDSGSISLIPGVFQKKTPPPRILLRGRQLSPEERVIEWLYKSCTHASTTLPLV